VRLDAGVLGSAPHLRLVVIMATGTDNVDLDTARRLGITVCNVRDYAGPSVAEHTLMLMLALQRGLIPARDAVRAGEWSRSPFFCLHAQPIAELHGRRLGIVGYGHLGAAVARLASAFGMQIALAALPGTREPAEAPYRRMALRELLPWVDVLSLHCPLNAQTRGLIGAPELALMRPDAVLINTARGGLVDEVALLGALAGSRLAGAGIDTLEEAPPRLDAALPGAGLSNLIVTPHVAWASREARTRLLAQIVAVIDAFLAGEPVNRVA